MSEEESARTPPAPEPTDLVTCHTCNYTFDSRADQILHYKLDWHAYNLRARLRGAEPLGEEQFGEGCSDVSSLSGEDEDEGGEEKGPQFVTSQFLGEQEELHDAVILSPEIIFYHRSSLHKCLTSLLFSSSSTQPLTDTSLHKSVDSSCVRTEPDDLQFKGRVGVFLYSAQHFAGVVFDGDKVLHHKTYHRYTVRAKQGTVQGMRDGKGNAPKSFGASLRRYNQIALFTDIENLLVLWADTLASCSVIFHRTSATDRHVFDKLKEKLGPPSKHKIRPIPVNTYRPTLKEAKRVHGVLTRIVKSSEAELEEFRLTLQQRRELREGQSDKVEQVVQKPNPKSIPNSHLKQRPEKLMPQINGDNSESQEEEVMFYQDPDNIYHKLISAIKSADLGTFTSLLSAPEVDLTQPLDKGNTLLHLASFHNNLQILQLLLSREASPEAKNESGKTPYEVANSKDIRDEFRRYSGRFPDKWDYKAAKIPSPLTSDMEEEQARKRAEKKKAQRVAKNKRDKERKAAEKEAEKRAQDDLVAGAQKLRMRGLTARERCLLAAEVRLANEAGLRGNASGSCDNCETGLDGLVPFERLKFRYCSVTCVKEHRGKIPG